MDLNPGTMETDSGTMETNPGTMESNPSKMESSPSTIESSPGLFALFSVFKHLRPCDLLVASQVCKTWKFVASHPSCWDFVKLREHKVNDWDALGDVLSSRGTRYLDLLQMQHGINSVEDEDKLWEDICRNLKKIRTLCGIKLGKCPPSGVIGLAEAAPQLTAFISKSILATEMNFAFLANCPNLTTLKLKSYLGSLEIKDFSFLDKLPNLRTLSLLSIKNLKGIENHLSPTLEMLELGGACTLPLKVATETLQTLVNLTRLRLEKGERGCPTMEILRAVARHPKIHHLELINFDVETGFDVALGSCTNLKTFFIFPTYSGQSSTTSYIVLKGVMKLKETLKYFIWGWTLEIIELTEIFLEQAPDSRYTMRNFPKVQRIPIKSLMVLMGLQPPPCHPYNYQVEFPEISKFHLILKNFLPNSRVRFIKVPYSVTWRSFIHDANWLHD